jgi:cytochrome c biogenesis protein CcmG/thiol:disulfide interchange protein DsbE
MRLSGITVLGLVSLCLTAPISKAADPPTVRAKLVDENERTPAPKFTLQDASGKDAKIADYRGKVLLLNFWATWCGGCKLEIPWFQEFQTSFGSREFSVLGVSVDEKGWDVVKPYLEKTGVSYRMVVADQSMPQDYSVKALPATFLIDRKGRIAASYFGVVDRSDIETNIQAVLGKK